MTTKNAMQDLTVGAVGRTLIVFSVPFVLSTLLQTMYSTVDTIVVGQVVGSAGLSAVSVGSQIMNLMNMIVIGFATAGQILLAQAKGAGKEAQIQRIIGTLVFMMAAISVLLGLICLSASSLLLRMMQAPPEASAAARAYVMICGAGMIFTGFYNMFSAILRGLGDSRHPLVFVAIASLINLTMDLILIAGLRMGAVGAAIGTVIGQAASVLFSVLYLNRHRREMGFSLSPSVLHYDAQSAGMMVRLGLPMALQSGAVQISFLFVGSMVNSYGLVASAALGVSQKLREVPHVVTNAIGMGAASMIGQNLGARKLDRVKETVWVGIKLCLCVNAVFFICFILAPRACFGVFTQDADVLGYAAICALTLALELPGKALMPTCNALVNAQGFVVFKMTLALVDAFVGRVLCSYLLGSVMGLGVIGFFFGYTLATYLTAIPVFLYFLWGKWEKRELLA
ncbi:MAG: MATE family efflux transporter [Candidatus Ventricola sp.]